MLQYTNFSDFGFHIMYNPHGTTHLAIGGVWNADWHKKLLLDDYDMVQAPSWTLLGFAKQKNMYRAGFSVCPHTCSMDTPESECKCACEDVISKINDKKYLRILEKIMEGYLPYLNDREGNYLGDEIYKLLCNYYDDTYATMGDSLESASPADVSFWPTHPTVDRLFQWRRLNGMGMHWPDNSAWSVEGTRTAYCHGHNVDDVLPFTGLFDDSNGPYTNRELLALADPADSGAPYIYDNFEWPHCLDEGYSVDLLLCRATCPIRTCAPRASPRRRCRGECRRTDDRRRPSPGARAPPRARRPDAARRPPFPFPLPLPPNSLHHHPPSPLPAEAARETRVPGGGGGEASAAAARSLFPREAPLPRRGLPSAAVAAGNGDLPRHGGARRASANGGQSFPTRPLLPASHPARSSRQKSVANGTTPPPGYPICAGVHCAPSTQTPKRRQLPAMPIAVESVSHVPAT